MPIVLPSAGCARVCKHIALPLLIFCTWVKILDKNFHRATEAFSAVTGSEERETWLTGIKNGFCRVSEGVHVLLVSHIQSSKHDRSRAMYISTFV